MDITVHIVMYCDIINQVIPVQVQVVDPGILIVEVSLETFQGFGLLEKFHHCIKIHVVTRESQVFFLSVLCLKGGSGCHQHRENDCE